jgi:NADPH:quinone reductase
MPFHVGYLALHRRAKLVAGETLLVVGGASAVGTAVIQLGVAAGADVIAVAGGAEKGRLCEELGASFIDHTSADLFDEVIARTDQRGADVAVDLVGGERTEIVWTCMAREGRYLPVGFNDDPQSGLTGRPLRKVSMGNISVLGVILGYGELSVDFRRFGLNMFPAEVVREVHAALLELVSTQLIRPVVGRTITMDQVAAALDDHEQRRTTGRTVVAVTGD